MLETFKLLPQGYHLDDGLLSLAAEVLSEVKGEWEKRDEITVQNQMRVLRSFHQVGVSATHFSPGNGYGYGDLGREGIERVFARVFAAEAALVRWQMVSGSHALATALFGLLRPGDELLSVTGTPYDTLREIIGFGQAESTQEKVSPPPEGEPSAGEWRTQPDLTGQDPSPRSVSRPGPQDGGRRLNPGSLADFGVTYRQIAPRMDGTLDEAALREAVNQRTRVVFLQRSRGYTWTAARNLEQIKDYIQRVKAINPGVLCLVDNCYGEFVETREPTQVGADLVVGSLIKNPGGGLAPTGGYLAGRADLVEAAAARLYAPGLGSHVGPSLGDNRLFFQGLFLAPHLVGEAIKGAIFTARLFERLGYEVSPHWQEQRTDLIQALRLGKRERLLSFCQAVQSASPVDAHVRPEPWAMPGYSDEVIMAAGTFVQGASLELSADGPLREPYIAYLQGGLVKEQVILAALLAAQRLGDR
ncbi:MAG: methionine gamma-lyase family protein [Firmicutes bacterium]|nr:methionine gamma-lyase family protein [Bacillota bacterium]